MTADKNKKIKMMTNFGLAGDEIQEGLLKTVYFAGNGVFEKKTGSWMGSHVAKASNYVLNTAAENMEESYSLQEQPAKLPLRAYAAAYHFYKHIVNLNGAEAQINFYINKNNLKEIKVDDEIIRLKDIKGLKFWSKDVLSYVPIQTNSGARTSTTDPIYKELRKVMQPFIETHSHNTMSAFKSGTDAANSHNEGLQLVFGKLGSDDTYDFKSWATVSGKQFDDISREELAKFIELPNHIGSVRQLNGYKAAKKLLAEWTEQCTFQASYKPTTYSRTSSYPSFSRTIYNSSNDDELEDEVHKISKESYEVKEVIKEEERTPGFVESYVDLAIKGVDNIMQNYNREFKRVVDNISAPSKVKYADVGANTAKEEADLNQELQDKLNSLNLQGVNNEKTDKVEMQSTGTDKSVVNIKRAPTQKNNRKIKHRKR